MGIVTGSEGLLGVITEVTVSVVETMLSQPALVGNVSLYTPAMVWKLPPSKMLSPVQMLAVAIVVVGAITLNVTVVMLSQPLLPMAVSVYMPAVVWYMPPMSALSPMQMEMASVPLSAGNTVRSTTISESQPPPVTMVSL